MIKNPSKSAVISHKLRRLAALLCALTFVSTYSLHAQVRDGNARPKNTSTAVVVEDVVHPGLHVVGRTLKTPCGDTVLLRGVNKMVVWTPDLDLRKETYAEIRKSGANCVRIVWLVQPGPTEVDAGVDGLDRTIQDCIDNDMIPMVELHDATGDWSKLQMVVDYWKRPDVVSVIKKHEKYLIVNIANECGDFEVTDEMFKTGYTSAVAQMRTAGIHTPLVIDGADWGKNLEQLVRVGSVLTNADPDKNLMFSVHTYWPTTEGADAAYITSQFQAAANAGLPLIIGEFAGLFNRGGACTYEADYATMIMRAKELGFGYLAWEWGPGNEFAHPTCTVMNMTTDSHFSTLQVGWATDVAVSSAYSIKNTSKTPQYIINAGVCTTSDVADERTLAPEMSVVPNPFHEHASVIVYTRMDGRLRVSIVNILGEVVATLADGFAPLGRHDVALNLTDYTSNQVLFCIVESCGVRSLLPIQHIR